MKKMLSLGLVLILSLGLCVPALAADFPDVPKSHGFYTAITDCAERGIIGGYSDGKFQPARTVIRSSFAVMLSRAFYAGDVAKYSTDQYLSQGTFMPNFIALRENGILDGISWADSIADGSVRAQVINRYEMAQLMTNIMKQNGFAASSAEKSAVIPQITDYGSIPAAYQDAVANVYALGIITGYSDGSFNGEGSMTRGQACVVIYRMMQRAGDAVQAPAHMPYGVLLANGKTVTDDNIREIIYGLKAEYPEGRSWTDDDDYYSEALRSYGGGCAAFGLICSDAVFGALPISSQHSDFDRIRVGDMVRVNHDTHTVVVLEKRVDSIVVVEGNYNQAIHWGREISRKSLEAGEFYAETRYPY